MSEREELIKIVEEYPEIETEIFLFLWSIKRMYEKMIKKGKRHDA